jgi:hypothetical protein
MRDAAKIYRTFIGFEERAASLYLDLALRFLNDADLSWFWVEMSMEEKRHAGLLQFCLRQGIAAQKQPERAAVRRLTDLFRSLEKRAAGSNLSVDDAFFIAADLEFSEINGIYAQLIGPIQGPWYILRQKIETSIPGHIDELIQGARRFGVSSPTMARLVDLGGRKFRSAS